MRWPAAWAFIVLTKITPGIGLLWFVVRREWRQLAVALAATAAISLVSLVLAPDLWSGFLEASKTQLAATVDVPRQAAPIPLPLRLVVSAVLVVWGARTDRAWVLPIAVGLSVPFLWWNAIAVMVAAVPLAGWRPAASTPPAPEAAPLPGRTTRRTRLMRLGLDRVWLILALALPALAALIAPLPAVDLAYQVRAGDLILATGQIPATDTFTFTVAGSPWLDQQWLAQVLLAAGYRLGGWEALAVLRALLVAATFGLVAAVAIARGTSQQDRRDPGPARVRDLVAGPRASPAAVRDRHLRRHAAARGRARSASSLAAAGARARPRLGQPPRQLRPRAAAAGVCVARRHRPPPTGAAIAGGPRCRHRCDLRDAVRTGGLVVRGRHRRRPADRRAGQRVAANDAVHGAGPVVLPVGDRGGRTGGVAASPAQPCGLAVARRAAADRRLGGPGPGLVAAGCGARRGRGAARGPVRGRARAAEPGEPAQRRPRGRDRRSRSFWRSRGGVPRTR